MPVEFSVVIPTYRRPRELGEAVTSVLGQAGIDLEVVVVDDCPGGSAQGVVDDINDSRVTYLRTPQPSKGRPSVVRNFGWPRTTGVFLHFLDDDDIVPKGFYMAVRRAFEAFPDVGLIFGRVEPFGVGPEAQLREERRYFHEAARKSSKCGRFGRRWGYVGRMLFDQAILVCSAGVVRRECVRRVGGFDPDIRLMEDAEFYTRIMRECGVCFLEDVAIRYRIGSPSLMHSPNPTTTQLLEQQRGHQQMHIKYKAERGVVEFYSLALFTRTILKVI